MENRDESGGGKGSKTKRNRQIIAKKSLFGEVDHSEISQTLQTELSIQRERDKLKWNFDFEREVPLEGPFTWELVSTGGISDASTPLEEQNKGGFNVHQGIGSKHQDDLDRTQSLQVHDSLDESTKQISKLDYLGEGEKRGGFQSFTPISFPSFDNVSTQKTAAKTVQQQQVGADITGGGVLELGESPTAMHVTYGFGDNINNNQGPRISTSEINNNVQTIHPFIPQNPDRIQNVEFGQTDVRAFGCKQDHMAMASEKTPTLDPFDPNLDPIQNPWQISVVRDGRELPIPMEISPSASSTSNFADLADSSAIALPPKIPSIIKPSPMISGNYEDLVENQGDLFGSPPKAAAKIEGSRIEDSHIVDSAGVHVLSTSPKVEPSRRSTQALITDFYETKKSIRQEKTKKE